MSHQTKILPPPTGQNRSWRWPVALLVLVVAGGGFYLQYGQHAEPSQADAGGRGRRFGGGENTPAVVAVETAQSGDFPIYLNALGTVTALRTVTVKPRVDGELVRVAFSEGQMVKEGDLLAEIDPRPFQIQVQQAEGQLLRDQALLKNAELDHQRYLTLLAQDSIAAQQTVTQEAQVKQYQGSIEMDKAQLNNARLQLEYARVTAPISGRVGLRQVDQGNIVRASDANGLLVITQLQPISVVFTVAEDKLPAVVQRYRTGQELAVEAFDRAGKIKLASGKVTAIDNQIDPATGTIKLKAQFDNREQTLFANQFVNVRMHLDTLHNATQVSSGAIQHDVQGAYVYVVDADNIAHLRRVEPGASEADKVVLPGNLASGEAVILTGHDRVKDGAAVDVAERDGQAVAAKPGPQPGGDQPGKRSRRG